MVDERRIWTLLFEFADDSGGVRQAILGELAWREVVSPGLEELHHLQHAKKPHRPWCGLQSGTVEGLLGLQKPGRAWQAFQKTWLKGILACSPFFMPPAWMSSCQQITLTLADRWIQHCE